MVQPEDAAGSRVHAMQVVAPVVDGVRCRRAAVPEGGPGRAWLAIVLAGGRTGSVRGPTGEV